MLVNFILLFNESSKLAVHHGGTIIKIGTFCFQRFIGRYAAAFCKKWTCQNNAVHHTPPFINSCLASQHSQRTDLQHMII